MGIGVAATVLGGMARVALAPTLAGQVPFVTLYPAVAAAAWAGGYGAGIIATLLGAPLAALLFIPPTGAITPAELPSLAAFTLGGLFISVLGGNLRAERERAEASRRRAALLAEGGRRLAETFEPLAVIDALLASVVPAVADWGIADLRGDSGPLDVERVSPGAPALATAGRLWLDMLAELGLGPASVLEKGEPVLVADVRRSPPIAGEPGRLAHAQGLEMRSYACVPIAAGSRRLGTLAVVTGPSHRTLESEDVSLLGEVAARGAIALDHARLYRRVAARGEELDRVIGLMDDGVLVADEAGRVRSHNPAAARLLGSVPGTLEAAMSVLDERPAGVLHVQATGRYVRRSDVSIEAADERSHIVVLRDVTDQLEVAAAQDAFLGTLSHELRTPITTIYAGAHLLGRVRDRALRDELTGDLAVESERLLRLVEDLLVVSRFERGRLAFAAEPLLLQHVLPRVLAAEQGRWPGLDVRLEVPPRLPTVRGDATYVEQVTRNLLSNAAKYAGSAGPITITACPVDGEVRVEVADCGPGIPELDRERVFGLYERLAGADSAAKGTGIGLYVCRRLVELMGGRIDVAPNHPSGAIFGFTLPILEEEPGQ